jgi:hypothetical protein
MSKSKSKKDKEVDGIAIPETKNECVQVVIRCRPLSSTEKKNGNAK